MLRRICLTVALSGCALLAAPLCTADLSSPSDVVIGTAHAADFTGRIKRVRIKKKRVGGGYRLAVTTEGSSSSSVASAEVTLRDATSGEAIDHLSMKTPKRGAIELGGYTDLIKPETVKVELFASTIADDGSPTKEAIPTTVSLPLTVTELGGLFGEATNDDGWKVRVRVSPEGELKGTLRNTNPKWLGDGVSAATLHTSADSSSIGLGTVRQRLTARTDADLETIGLITTETTLFDAKGSVIDAYTSTSDLSSGTDIPTFSSVAVRETKAGNAKLVTWTRSKSDDTALTVELTDADTGKVVLSEVDKTPRITQRNYYAGGLAFEEGESAEGYVYLALIDLLNENGEPVGQQMEVELKVPAAVDGELGTEYVQLGDELGAVGIVVNEDGYHLKLGLKGNDNGGVVSANVIFEEPFEGPAPLETEVRSDYVGQINKWTQSGNGGVPDNYTVSSSLSTRDGQVVGTVNADGSGTARVAGNGKGTKKSISVQQAHIPLL